VKIRLTAFLVLIICLIFTGQAFAQESEETPEPSSGQEDFITFYDVRMAEYRSQREERTLANYRIVYLGNVTTTYEGDLFSQENILANFPDISVLTSADEVAAWALDGEANAIVIHPSALAWIDVKWVQEAYLHGASVGTIGLRYEQHAELTGDYCTLPAKSGDPSANNPNEVRSFNSTTMLISVWVLDDHLLTSEERERSYATGLIECDLPDLEREVEREIQSGYEIVSLDLGGLEQFENVLTYYAGTRERVISESIARGDIVMAWHNREVQK